MKWIRNLLSPSVIPEDVRRQAHDAVLAEMQASENFALHKDVLCDMLTIISSAITAEEFPRQLGVILKEIGNNAGTRDFSKEDAAVFANAAAAIAKRYEQEVQTLMKQKEAEKKK